MRLKNVKPVKLRRLIKEFLSWYPQLKSKTYAVGRCWDMTKEFIDIARSRKLKGDLRAIKADKLPEYKKYDDSHWIVWIDGLHIDFTARQFHPSFTHPRIWRGTHRCSLIQWGDKRKNDLGIDRYIDAWEYIPNVRDK